MTLIVDARIGKDGLSSLGFIPAFINRDAQPEPIREGDSRFDQIVAYMRWCNEEAGFSTRLEVSDGRVEVLPA
jgi:poly-gamma-glutamate synthesis protein (capsule biosynthesis protein)